MVVLGNIRAKGSQGEEVRVLMLSHTGEKMSTKGLVLFDSLGEHRDIFR
jgi:hypothetical protein